MKTTRADHLFVCQYLVGEATRREPADQVQQATTTPDAVEFERRDQVFDIQAGQGVELFGITLSAQRMKAHEILSGSAGCVREEALVQCIVGSLEIAAPVERACAAVDAIGETLQVFAVEDVRLMTEGARHPLPR